MVQDFVRFPELPLSRMTDYFESPHKQIFGSFMATVIKVTDGDTIRVMWEERDFDFPIRLSNINAPERGEPGWKEAGDRLRSMILDEEVDIIVDPNNRLDRWGRLLGTIIHRGLDVNQDQVNNGYAVVFGSKAFDFPDTNEYFRDFGFGENGT